MGTVVDGNDCCGDGAGMGMKATGMGRDGDNVENDSGDLMGMGITGVGTVGDVDKCLSPCSSLV